MNNVYRVTIDRESFDVYVKAETIDQAETRAYESLIKGVYAQQEGFYNEKWVADGCTELITDVKDLESASEWIESLN